MDLNAIKATDYSLPINLFCLPEQTLDSHLIRRVNSFKSLLLQKHTSMD